MQVTSALSFSEGTPIISLRRHCGLPRVLDSPAVQFALASGHLIVGVTARFSPSSHVHKARALGVMSYSHRILRAFKGSRLRMPFAQLSLSGGGRISIAGLLSRGIECLSSFLLLHVRRRRKNVPASPPLRICRIGMPKARSLGIKLLRKARFRRNCTANGLAQLIRVNHVWFRKATEYSVQNRQIVIRACYQSDHPSIASLAILWRSRFNFSVAQHSLKSRMTSGEGAILCVGTFFERISHLNCGHFFRRLAEQKGADCVRQTRSRVISHSKHLSHFPLFLGRHLDKGRENADGFSQASNICIQEISLLNPLLQV